MMRAFPSRMFPHTVYVRADADALTAMGGSNPVANPPGTPLPAWVQIRSAHREDRALGEAMEPRSVRRANLFFPSDPAVIQGHTILWGNTFFNVLAPAIDEGGQGVCYRVECEAVG